MSKKKKNLKAENLMVTCKLFLSIRSLGNLRGNEAIVTVKFRGL